MSPPRYIFRKQRRWYSSPLAVFFLSLTIIGGLFVTQGFRRGEVKPLFQATPTPTRIPESFALEAETHFSAGSLDAAIASYEEAIKTDPQNGRLYAELGRILTYSTESQTTQVAKQERFNQALEATQKAIELSPEDSTAFAVRAFALDWYASFNTYILLNPDEGARLLTEGEQAVSKAIVLDETNVLAQVFRAEIMIDQQRWDQAGAAISEALQRAPNLWDAHRVNGLFLESQGYYLDSIEAFERARDLAPNMTFLYIKLGMAYRNLALNASPPQDKVLYETAIGYFDRAVRINEQLGIKDPMPYLGIGRTYAQIGESLASSLNMNKALQYNPYNADVYAQLGMVYRQARNYEDAISALKCAVEGCSAQETCALRKCDEDVDPAITIEGMELNGLTVVYYYSYASLLAGMYLPRDERRSTYCDQSTVLIRKIRASSYGADQTISEILNESEAICRAMLSGGSLPTSEPAEGMEGTPRAPTPTPTAILTPTLFPTPEFTSTPEP
jgi:tetratricopeptide (TPR) repeat protein